MYLKWKILAIMPQKTGLSLAIDTVLIPIFPSFWCCYHSFLSYKSGVRWHDNNIFRHDPHIAVNSEHDMDAQSFDANTEICRPKYITSKSALQSAARAFHWLPLMAVSQTNAINLISPVATQFIRLFYVFRVFVRPHFRRKEKRGWFTAACDMETIRKGQIILLRRPTE